jgi:deazaflavin-dependent oxidoreductase (nitroreductase family)
MIFKLFTQFQVFLFHLTRGKAMSSMRGMPILLLTTRGRKSGQTRTTPVMYIREGENYVITASNNGSDQHPAWLLNLRASPQVEIEVPGKRMLVTASEVDQLNKDRLWAQLTSDAPFFEGYKKGTTRSIPMVWLRP